MVIVCRSRGQMYLMSAAWLRASAHAEQCVWCKGHTYVSGAESDRCEVSPRAGSPGQYVPIENTRRIVTVATRIQLTLSGRAEAGANASMVHGALGEFNPDGEEIGSYLERFDFYCSANGIFRAEQKKAVFLSTVGHVTFERIKDLLHPVGLDNASLSDIRTGMLEHFKPQNVEIAERFKFFKRMQQADESVSEYIATLKKCSLN